MSDPTTRKEAIAALLRSTTPVLPTAASRDYDVVDDIVAVTARLFRISEEDVRGGRDRWSTTARGVALAVARANTSLSMLDLGAEFDRDHCSVWKAIRKVTQTPTLCAWAAAVNAELAADAGRVTA